MTVGYLRETGIGGRTRPPLVSQAAVKGKSKV
jgi:hypothetical protein